MWSSIIYDDDNPAHRRLIGYTHDQKSTLPPTTGGCNGCPDEEGLEDDPSMNP
jgi:hypothetical protein